MLGEFLVEVQFLIAEGKEILGEIGDHDPDGWSGIMILKDRITENDGLGSTDWETTLKSQRAVKLTGETGPTWAVEIFSNHIGGSGSYSRLFVLSCMNGRITELVQAGAEGLRVSLLNDGHIVLTSAVWYPKDAHCCPSADTRVVLRWNGDKRSFEIERQGTSKRKR